MRLTIIAVLDVPGAVAERSEDDKLFDIAKFLAEWRTHDDVGRFAVEVAFATVAMGVTAAAREAGADVGEHLDEEAP